MPMIICPVCNSDATNLFRTVDVYPYYQCDSCKVLFITPAILDKMDQGAMLIDYNKNYWKKELYAAKERSWGVTLARVAEVFLYAKLPIRNFIDIGSGPGYFLDAINYQLPSSTEIFHAVELFPPAKEFCTKHKNYYCGNLSDLNFEFDAGCCIEVIEHLTPNMVRGMLSDIAKKSIKSSIYIFNTGLIDYIINEDINYLDPIIRGHVIGWSIPALRHIAEPLGFNIIPIPGKTWAFIAEYMPDHGFEHPLNERIWTALQENKQTLKDKQTGELMYVLGLDTARAYY